MSHLRPTRSDQAPVTSWPRPHTAGYTAARIPIRATERPAVAKKMGSSPQAMPSLRLFTSPAWLAADSDGSRYVVSANTAMVDMSASAVVVSSALLAASKAANSLVSLTASADSPRPSAA